MQKKKVLFHSDFSRVKTGFGLSAKAVLSYLYKTGKYEVIEYAGGTQKYNDPVCQTTPWKCYGAQPNHEAEIAHITDPGAIRMIHYGSWNIDRVIREEKPDVYIGSQDIWAFSNYWDKPWWNKIPCAVWTTLDSLPIYPQAVDAAEKIKNYWVWASFAERALKKKGFDHVQTMPGMIDTSFAPVTPQGKKELRKAFKIDEDCIVFGFVFRNQLRKLVHSVLEGLAEFKKANKKVKAKVLLHTNYSEQWDIKRYIEEFGLDNDDVLTTYYCRACKGFYVIPWVGNKVDCQLCGTKESAGNVTVIEGLSQKQLNCVYGLMDAYIHPMTSGGLEIPIAEAMLCGLPVATVPYSCGEDFTQHKFVYSLQYTTYREANSNFIKANPVVSSVKAFMEKVSRNKEQYQEYGKQGRAWALNYFSHDRIGKFLEDFIDNSSHEFDFDFTDKKKNPFYPMPDIQDNTEWLIDLYKNMLLMQENSNTDGVKHWLARMEQGITRQQVYEFFVKVAEKDNAQAEKLDIRNLIKPSSNKKLVYIMPGSYGDCIISLNVLKTLRRDYPGWDIYVCTKQVHNVVFEPFMGELLDGLIPYAPIMDQFRFWEGGGPTDKIVDVAFHPYVTTQILSCYTHNGEDKNYLQNKTLDLNARAFKCEEMYPDWTLQTR